MPNLVPLNNEFVVDAKIQSDVIMNSVPEPYLGRHDWCNARLQAKCSRCSFVLTSDVFSISQLDFPLQFYLSHHL